MLGTLRRTLDGLGVEVADLGGAGRTDAGVHALGQVAHLRVPRALDHARLERALDDALPATVHVLRIEPAPVRFHARHDAVSRSYLYQLSRRRTAFGKRLVWWMRDELDLGRLRNAVALAVGRHDFRSFCEAPSQQSSTLVEVERIEVVEAGALVLVRLEASHFLWKMVRRLVGASVRVATGQLELDELRELIAGGTLAPGRGAPAQWTAPASGLFLEAVRYSGDPALPPPEPVCRIALGSR